MPQTCPGSVVSTPLVRSQRGLIALLVGLALSVGMSLGAQAATTWTVCASGCDYTRIKAAIAASTTMDGDTLALAAGTYTEPGIVVNKSLTLQGEGAATTIVQAAAAKGTASDRVFAIPIGVTATIRGLTIRYGHTADHGGGLHNAGTLTLSQSSVRGNHANLYGGGLYNDWFGTLTLTTSTISSNTAGVIGGGLGSWGTLTLTHSSVSDNAAKYNGGGLYNGGTLTLTHSTVSGNSATTYAGGGLYSWGTLTLTHSTVSGNTVSSSYGAGGGLFNWNSGTLTLTHSTVSGNSATRGGGLYADGGTLTLTHSTVSGNTATTGGGLYSRGTPTLTHSIIANNFQGGDCIPDYIISKGYNLDSDGSCQLTAPIDLPGTDPRLGSLQNNGGPTLTHALLPGSPAIDAIPWGTNGCGTTLFSDQRWQARPQPAGGACDIGAYEVEVAGQPLGGWVAGITPHTAVCENVTTEQAVTLNAPVLPWDCEAAGLAVTAGDVVALRVRGPVKKSATDVGGAVVGMTPSGGGCTNRTTGQQVKFEALFQGQRGATAASCVAAGLVVQPGDQVQIRVQGVAE